MASSPVSVFLISIGSGQQATVPIDGKDYEFGYLTTTHGFSHSSGDLQRRDAKGAVSERIMYVEIPAAVVTRDGNHVVCSDACNYKGHDATLHIEFDLSGSQPANITASIHLADGTTVISLSPNTPFTGAAYL